MAEPRVNVMSQLEGRGSAMLGGGAASRAATEAIEREYRQHVEMMQAEGEEPMTMEEFIRQRGRG